MSMDFHIFVLHNGINDTLKELDKDCETALKAVGSIALNYAEQDCPVDTGRLRNSLTYATENSQGGQNTSSGEAASPSDYALHGKPKPKVCVIGTNVEYAPVQENIHHYLRDAAGNHNEEYKSLIKDVLDE